MNTTVHKKTCARILFSALLPTVKIMKKKITQYIHKEYDWLFGKDIDDRINSLSLPEVNNE